MNIALTIRGVSDIFNYDECFLSYYGLPEPDEKPTIPWLASIFWLVYACSGIAFFQQASMNEIRSRSAD